MILVTSNTPGKIHSSQKQVEGAANAAHKFKHSNMLAMCGNPLTTAFTFEDAQLRLVLQNTLI